MAELTAEQTAFISIIADSWAAGLTQKEIAEKLSINRSTMITRLAYYGYKFGRAGKLIALRSPEVEAVA